MRHLPLIAAILLTSCATKRSISTYQGSPQSQPYATTITTPQANHSAGQTNISSTQSQPQPPTPTPSLTPLQQQYQQLANNIEAQIAPLSQRATVAVCAYDINADQWIIAHNPHLRMRPASTQKAITAITALHLLGPDYQLTTTFSITGQIRNNTLHGDLHIKGAMDPLLTRAHLNQAARQLRAAGINRIEGKVYLDATMKDTDKWGWGWCWDDDNPTLTPLLVDGHDTMATHITTALRAAGITGPATGRRPTNATTPPTARTITTITHTLTEVLKPMLEDSHNLSAEALFYHIAAHNNPHTATRRQAATHIEALLQQVNADTPLSTIADGSGLSLYNYQTAYTFIRLLTHAATTERILPALYNNLPIAAQTGTLRTRLISTPAAHNLHAKTGSVSGVSTLVGYTTSHTTNHLIAFAILTNGVTTMAEGRNLQDRIAALISE